jgi:hypothetical protein
MLHDTSLNAVPRRRSVARSGKSFLIRQLQTGRKFTNMWKRCDRQENTHTISEEKLSKIYAVLAIHISNNKQAFWHHLQEIKQNLCIFFLIIQIHFQK